MTRMSWGLSILSLLSVAAHLAAAGPSAEDRLLDALESRMDFEVIKAPLAQAVKLLAEKTGVAIQLDDKDLENVGFDPTTPVTFRGKNFRLRSILAHVLSPHRLKWTLRDDALFVTSDENANGSMTVRVYPVGDLQGPAHAAGWLQTPNSPIASLIQKTVAPASWEQVGGPGTLREMKEFLVIRQTAEVHREIAHAFDLLRSVGDSYRKWDGKQRPVPGLETSASLRLEADDDTAIIKALETPVTLSLQKTPLPEVMAFLSEKTGISFAIDEKRMEDAGIDSQSEISVEAKEIPLRSALRMMLKPYDLSFRIWNETVQITTADAMQESPTLRMYPVFDFARTPRTGDLELDDGKATDAAEVAEVLRTTIEPQTWDSAGGPGVVEYFAQPGVLVVSQSAEVHDEVSRLLTRLREKLPVLGKEDRQAEGQRYVTRVYRLVQAPPTAGLPEIPSAEELANLVRKVVAPDAWGEKLGEIHPAKNVLVIRQKALLHPKIERLLGELGAIALSFGGEGGGGLGGVVPVVGQAQPDAPGRPVGGGGFFAIPAK